MKIRRATRLDTRQMADLLNGIIAAGGTTALTDPVTGDMLWDWIETGSDRAAWHVAEQDGEIVGFQWIGPQDDLPEGACDIASFVRIGQTGLGIGSKLFDATQEAARDLGYAWINANIRADNDSGLTYYQSRGFRVYGHVRDYRLNDGQVVDKVLKRFDLD
ncbi:GNAT family N-acetyltransferase [Thalassovita aquimarina]|uniref:GNAT family N-acetyltransferase n=1 Tax=Thalassovita aquimarina TaxID=2785917 RepID=A0ABS5HN76_9RHOB|nr:GNAT family N-acetyltransferase [Thalassovita aquimarina]MBR9650395.1 GNAT family N-acetyltransferase [Thalassovita aquimarina]